MDLHNHVESECGESHLRTLKFLLGLEEEGGWHCSSVEKPHANTHKALALIPSSKKTNKQKVTKKEEKGERREVMSLRAVVG